MKWDFCVGNPAYQETQDDTSDKPVYNYFLDEAFKVAEKVEMIHPARFLFNAGKTPKAWNEKMLNDSHFKVEFYEQNSDAVFKGTDIKGGVAITYRDSTKCFGTIGTFSHFEELRTIKQKVITEGTKSLDSLVFAPESYRFTKKIHEDYPQIKYVDETHGILSKGHDFDLTTNIFDKLDGIVFFENCPLNSSSYVRILGRKSNDRVYRYICGEYIAHHENLKKWKVILPKSNGSGALGEVLSTPLIGQPLIGHTQSFISIGAFETENEADALLKYVKSKFARAMLGILKVTQDNKKAVWKYVPLQDFTDNSDINWNTSVANIDKQLYKKYGLTQEEIDFIETHVKEMV